MISSATLTSLLIRVLLPPFTYNVPLFPKPSPSCLFCFSIPSPYLPHHTLFSNHSSTLLPSFHLSTPSSHHQATHYSFLATLEVLGKLTFSALAGGVVDWFGFQVAFLFFLTLSAATALHVWTATFTGALREHQLKEQPK